MHVLDLAMFKIKVDNLCLVYMFILCLTINVSEVLTNVFIKNISYISISLYPLCRNFEFYTLFLVIIFAFCGAQYKSISLHHEALVSPKLY